MDPDEQFFYDHAGYSFDPKKDKDAEAGHVRSAKALAAAERWLARQPGHTITWERDEDYNPDDYERPMPAIGWGCIVSVNGERRPPGTESLWGITFGDETQNEPWFNPYARVVVAELASELMPE
jgi:hypothetical protein